MQPPAEAAWARDLRVIQTEPSRSRISSSLSSIESQLRSGALNNGPEGGQVVHGTVQIVYALVFGTFGPMLQSVFNLTVLHKRSFQDCQSVMCTISGAMTRLFGGWAHMMGKKEVPMSLENILKPGMREFYIKIGESDEEAGTTKTFPRFEVALCFVWSCLLKSAERHGRAEHPQPGALVQLLDSWVSIPSGLWGAGRTGVVPGLMDEDAAKVVDDNSQDSPATVDMQALRELKKPLLRQRAAEMGVPADKIEAARDEDDEKGAMIKLIIAKLIIAQPPLVDAVDDVQVSHARDRLLGLRPAVVPDSPRRRELSQHWPRAVGAVETTPFPLLAPPRALAVAAVTNIAYAARRLCASWASKSGRQRSGCRQKRKVGLST